MTPPELIDIGANLTSSRFSKDLDQVLLDAQRAGVGTLIVTGTSLHASHDALSLVRDYAGRGPVRMHSTAGVHPHDAKTWDASVASELKQLAAAPEIVALGECGLDFNRNFSPPEAQLACFEAQLALAVELGKPVFLHQRDAHEDFLPLLQCYRSQLPGAVVHCFTGNGAELEDYLALDCHIGITGWLCDSRRGQALRELVKHIPVQRLMIETDAPYLTPHNLPKKPKGNRNEPGFLPYVLSALAECRDEPVHELAEQLSVTTRDFFRL